MNSPPPQSLRLFVAIQLPEEIRERVRKAQHELRQLLRASQVRWTSAEQWHLTMKFLGDVPTSSVEPLLQSLQQRTDSFGSLELRTGKVGVFPRPQSPRVLWMGVTETAGRLVSLHAVIEEAVRSFTAEPSEENFCGHITLGRVKRWQRMDDAGLHSAMGSGTGRPVSWTIDSVELMSSELQASGAKYTSLAQVRLGTGQ